MKSTVEKITSWMLKRLVPDARTLSRMSANSIREFVNSQPKDRAMQIERASALAERLSDLQLKISRALADGKLDEDETEALARLLEPVMSRLREAL